jgi:hypothetical protein
MTPRVLLRLPFCLHASGPSVNLGLTNLSVLICFLDGMHNPVEPSPFLPYRSVLVHLVSSTSILSVAAKYGVPTSIPEETLPHRETFYDCNLAAPQCFTAIPGHTHAENVAMNIPYAQHGYQNPRPDPT